MPNPQHAILTDLQKYQWYTHMSRTDGADLGVIKDALKKVRKAGDEVGVTSPLNVCLLFGPKLLAELTDDMPEDFQPYPGYEWFPYREYSEVFYGTDYKVLRGGSWATHATSVRNTFRNWDYPIRRQIFAAFRCARDA